jgi:hypothetical protein
MNKSSLPYLFFKAIKILLCAIGGAVAASFLLLAVAQIIFDHDATGMVTLMEAYNPLAGVVGALLCGFIAYHSR